MLITPPPPYRKRAAKFKASASSSTAALTLVGVDYNENGYADLRFDRAINVAGLIGSAITISDPGGEVEATLGGTTGSLIQPTTLRLMLTVVGPATGSAAALTATAGTGIVAANDGGAWAGVTNKPIPFS